MAKHNNFQIDPACFNCVFFDAKENFCNYYNDEVDPNDICDSYEQDEEPEPTRVKNQHKQHLKD